MLEIGENERQQIREELEEEILAKVERALTRATYQARFDLERSPFFRDASWEKVDAAAKRRFYGLRMELVKEFETLRRRQFNEDDGA